jgi:hypothetical protein
VSNLAWLIRTLPPEDRVWGEALMRELDEVPRRERPRWALGLLRLTGARLARRVMSPSGPAPGTARSVRTGLWLGVLFGVLGVAELAYSNLGPGSAHPHSDSAAPVLAAYALLGLLFVAIGFVQRVRGETLVDCARTTAIMAAVIVVLAFVSSLVIDNVWLHTVARQPDKIDGLAHSHVFHTMRMYLIWTNVLGLLVAAPVCAIGAAALGALGARARGA